MKLLWSPSIGIFDLLRVTQSSSHYIKHRLLGDKKYQLENCLILPSKQMYRNFSAASCLLKMVFWIRHVVLDLHLSGFIMLEFQFFSWLLNALLTRSIYNHVFLKHRPRRINTSLLYSGTILLCSLFILGHARLIGVKPNLPRILQNRCYYRRNLSTYVYVNVCEVDRLIMYVRV